MQTSGRPATLAAAQIEARPGRLDESIAAHLRLASLAAEQGASLVIFPELSLTGYSTAHTSRDSLTPQHSALAPLAKLACARGLSIVAGAPLASERGLLIGNIIFGADGACGTYSKRYIHHSESTAFAAGDGGPLLIVGGSSVGLAICAEVNHPAHFPDTVARGAAIYAASCFLSPGGYEKDCRRLETCTKIHGVPALMANYADSPALESAGGTAAWNDAGALIAAAAREGECLVVARRTAGRWEGFIRR